MTDFLPQSQFLNLLQFLFVPQYILGSGWPGNFPNIEPSWPTYSLSDLCFFTSVVYSGQY
ncbi:hypothetical protein B4135_2086 [Caldibacillus debilis]|uniref:Uncharacterized protein n=1 Tax=Caldibacillus debilis TaxID=301148 RepID=A0A150M4M2_9BACI|nr:hypothetical protein B4135_2086 [Caldibacillus debilis]